MQYSILGRSGLKVSVAGLGCGGPSRLGLRNNKTENESIALVRQALDGGVNLLDTAETYGTEEIIGKALDGISRAAVVLSTKKKFPLSDPEHPTGELKKSLEQSLRRLRTDYIDIYHVHGVEPQYYSYVADRLVPDLLRFKKQGKIRFLGISEAFVEDTTHHMLRQALESDYWDVVMLGFNILNQSARVTLLPKTLSKGIGVLVMFAVRKALSQPARLKEVWAELKEKGLVDPASCDAENPLGFLIGKEAASTMPEAAYRYCRHEPGAHVVLTGTGNPDHLRANMESLLKPPLPKAARQRLAKIFEKVDFLTGN